MNPIEVLTGYRLGGHQATVELQQAGTAAIHIEFDVLKLIPDIQSGAVRSVILTGTAGDGKTYLAFRILEALGIDRQAVITSQAPGGYAWDGVYVDLDLSAGKLSPDRVARIDSALGQPARLSLICANEGKLSELQGRLAELGYQLPSSVLRVNLSERALLAEGAWDRVLSGVLRAPFWSESDQADAPTVARNREMLQDSMVARHLRRYLLLPYLLGEPITVRETLSFLAYALIGDLPAEEATKKAGEDALPYLLFNTMFSEPAGYVHGQRAVPGEKLLWWMYRFDPGAMANPKADLQLLTGLENLDAAPPSELGDFWRHQVAIRPDEETDTEYRNRVRRYMRWARRWYALCSPTGHAVYFPFRHYADFLTVLDPAATDRDGHVQALIKGLNRLLSGGEVSDSYALNLYHPAGSGTARPAVVFSRTAIDQSDFELVSDAPVDSTTENYLERHPRRLYLCYRGAENTGAEIRLPISLTLYEVLIGAASPGAGFPATLWTREQHTVGRFMAALNRAVKRPAIQKFVIARRGAKNLQLAHNPKSRNIDITTG